MARRLSPLAIVLTTLAVAAPAPALAQDDGVIIDQQSPAAKEYAIPLDAAREAGNGVSGGATGGGGGTGRGAAPAPGAATGTSPDSARVPLFGEGISSAAGRKRGSEQPSAPAAQQGGAVAADDPEPAPASRVAERRAGGTGTGGTDSSAFLGTAGVGLGVLLVGGLVALAARRLPARPA